MNEPAGPVIIGKILPTFTRVYFETEHRKEVQRQKDAEAARVAQIVAAAADQLERQGKVSPIIARQMKNLRRAQKPVDHQKTSAYRITNEIWFSWSLRKDQEHSWESLNVTRAIYLYCIKLVAIAKRARVAPR